MLKPVYVRRDERDTLIEKEKAEVEDLLRKEKEQQKKEERKEQTTQLVLQTIHDEEAVAAAGGERGASDDEEMPSDTDAKAEEEAVEYEMWKIRELRRIKRDRDESAQFETQQREVERRR